MKFHFFSMFSRFFTVSFVIFLPNFDEFFSEFRRQSPSGKSNLEGHMHFGFRIRMSGMSTLEANKHLVVVARDR